MTTDAQDILDWVNSIDLPSCTLVDSLADLKSGVAIADMLSFFLKIPDLQGITRDSYTIEDIKVNWEIVLDLLQTLLGDEINELTADLILSVNYI